MRDFHFPPKETNPPCWGKGRKEKKQKEKFVIPLYSRERQKERERVTRNSVICGFDSLLQYDPILCASASNSKIHISGPKSLLCYSFICPKGLSYPLTLSPTLSPSLSPSLQRKSLHWRMMDGDSGTDAKSQPSLKKGERGIGKEKAGGRKQQG